MNLLFRFRKTHLALLSTLFLQFVAAQPEVEKKFYSNVSQRRLVQAVRDLVKLSPRTGGTTSGNLSAAYVIKKFKSAGLKVKVLDDPEKLTFTNVKWALKVEEPKELRRLIKNEWLGGYSPSVPPTRSELVSVSNANDVDDEIVKGKALLLDRLPSTKQYQELVESGATCLLLISPKLDGAYSDWALISDLKAVDDNAIPLFNLSYSNGARLKQALTNKQKIILSFSTQTVIARGVGKTVVATLDGKSDKHFIVCAHGDSDSGGPGADDNASGVSGVLELARLFGGMMRSKAIPKPAYTIKFIVWGTEIYSTQHYVKSYADELENIKGVLNFDEIGTGATRNCLYFESNDVEHNEPLLRVLEQIGDEFVGKKGFWHEATTNPSQGGTDSYVFLPNWLSRLKVPDVDIPSVTIYTGAWNEVKTLPQTEGWRSKAWKGHPDSVVVDYSAYYHSSLDVPALTTDKEPFNMVWGVKAVGIALLRLAW